MIKLFIFVHCTEYFLALPFQMTASANTNKGTVVLMFLWQGKGASHTSLRIRGERIFLRDYKTFQYLDRLGSLWKGQVSLYKPGRGRANMGYYCPTHPMPLYTPHYSPDTCLPILHSLKPPYSLKGSMKPLSTKGTLRRPALPSWAGSPSPL